MRSKAASSGSGSAFETLAVLPASRRARTTGPRPTTVTSNASPALRRRTRTSRPATLSSARYSAAVFFSTFATVPLEALTICLAVSFSGSGERPSWISA